jgi:hypothetical protein
MSPKRSKPTSAAVEFDKAWGRLIQSVMLGSNGRPDGEGWKTVKEFAAQTGMSTTRAGVVIQERYTSGAYERKTGKIGRHWVGFYRPKL